MDDAAAACLRVFCRATALQGPGDGDPPTKQIDVTSTQRRHLAPTQTGVGSEAHQQVARRSDARGEYFDLGRRQEAWLVTLPALGWRTPRHGLSRISRASTAEPMTALNVRRAFSAVAGDRPAATISLTIRSTSNRVIALR